MVKSLTLFSPAKVNLFLRILKRREDNYHELASLFQAITLFDTLTFTLSAQEDSLFTTHPHVPKDSSNLILKAIHLFRKKCALPFGVQVQLEKRIPLEGGLGGGSSNAATTLWALTRLCELDISLEELMSWGAELGSDVPFFLSEGSAYCRGKGEIVENIAPLSLPGSFSIIKPPFGVSTAAVYREFNISNASSHSPEALLAAFLQRDPQFVNDLELPATQVSPALLEAKRVLLESGYRHVHLTGSGSAFLCEGESICPLPSGYQIFPVEFCGRSPNLWYIVESVQNLTFDCAKAPGLDRS